MRLSPTSWSSLVALMLPVVASAQEQPAAEATLEKEPTPLEQALPKEIEPPKQTPAKEPAPALEISGSPGQGITIKTGPGFSINIRSRVQLRYQLVSAEKGPDQQQVSIGTARLYTSGNIFKPELTYLIQLAVAARDYRDSSTSPIYDAYLDWKPHRDFNIRAGQFFVPFDRLRTVREFALQIPDRARPVTELTLDRDVGVVFYSERFLGGASPVTYRVGAFGGGGNNLAVSKKPGTLVVGRLELRPFGPLDDDSDGDLERRKLPGLAIGVGAARNWNTDRTRSTTGPRFTGGTTDYTHLTADLVFKWHGFGLQAEYLYRKASADTIVSATTTEYTRSAQAWIVQASYTFSPPFEIVGRISRMYAFDGADPKFVIDLNAHGQEIGGGLNYYVNAHRFKFQAMYIARTAPNFNFDRAEHNVVVVTDVMF